MKIRPWFHLEKTSRTGRRIPYFGVRFSLSWDKAGSFLRNLKFWRKRK